MIPKKIHYCWFGKGNKPVKVKKCLESWEKILPDYEIIEWNESNFDINKLLFTKENYKLKKYAFVSDVARLEALYEYGGIYLDTDVIVKKNFNPFMKHNLFLGMMYDDSIGTAVIGSQKNNHIIYNLLKKYEDMPISNSPNNDIFTKYFIDNYNEFILDNIYQVLNDDITIYPKQFFERPTYSKKMGYSVHHAINSWNNGHLSSESIIKKIIKIILGEVLTAKIQDANIIPRAAYYNRYLEDKNRQNIIYKSKKILDLK